MVQTRTMSRTAIASAVLVTMGASAFAGAISSTPINIAQEAFGTASTTSTTVTIPAASPISYQFSTPGGIVINPGGTVHVTITPTGGAFASAGAVTVPTGVGAGTCLVGTATTVSGGALDIALVNSTTLGTTCTASGNAVIGVGATVSVAGGTMNNLLGLASGTPVTATGSVGVAVGGTELEATSASKSILTSSQVVGVVAAAATGAGFIDVTTTVAANIGKVLTGATGSLFETLGTVTFNDSTVTGNALDGSTPFNLANTTPYPVANTPVTYTLSLASGAFTAGTAFSLHTGSCTGSVITSTQSPLATSVTGATTTVTLNTLAVPVNGTSIAVCATFPGGAAISPYQPAIAATLAPASTSFTGETLAASNLYNLGYNGASVILRNYIPASVTGNQLTVRLINTGSSSATAMVSLIDDTTGVATTPVSVGTAMVPGAAQRLSQATIEAALGYAPGAMPRTTRPRLRFTAATASMELQPFFNNANGAYTNLAGVE